MKKFVKFTLTFLTILIYNLSFSQGDITVDTYYRQKPDETVAKESFYFGFLLSDRKLHTYDKDLQIKKNYYIKFDRSEYAKDGTFLLIYYPDINMYISYREKLTKPIIFAIIFDKKGGNIIGIQTIDEERKELYLTTFGAEFYNKL